MRLAEKGANLLSVKKPPNWWQLLLTIIPNPFNILLTLLAIISVATPPPAWSTFVLLVVMIVLSCVVRFWQERRGNVAAIRLQSKVTTEVRVRRRLGNLNSEDIVVDEKTLVPGDILLVDPGDAVPADCMVLEASSLQISQSRFDDPICPALLPLHANSLSASLGRANQCGSQPLYRSRKKSPFLNWRTSCSWELASSLEAGSLLS